MNRHTKEKDYGISEDFDDIYATADDEELEALADSMPVIERVIAARSHLAQLFEPLDDADDFDASNFIERAYQ